MIEITFDDYEVSLLHDILKHRRSELSKVVSSTGSLDRLIDKLETAEHDNQVALENMLYR